MDLSSLRSGNEERDTGANTDSVVGLSNTIQDETIEAYATDQVQILTVCRPTTTTQTSTQQLQRSSVIRANPTLNLTQPAERARVRCPAPTLNLTQPAERPRERYPAPSLNLTQPVKCTCVRCPSPTLSSKQQSEHVYGRVPIPTPTLVYQAESSYLDRPTPPTFQELHIQELNKKLLFNYIAKIRSNFDDNPQVCDYLLSTTQEFNSERIPLSEAILRVSNVFIEHPLIIDSVSMSQYPEDDLNEEKLQVIHSHNQINEYNTQPDAVSGPRSLTSCGSYIAPMESPATISTEYYLSSDHEKIPKELKLKKIKTMNYIATMKFNFLMNSRAYNTCLDIMDDLNNNRISIPESMFRIADLIRTEELHRSDNIPAKYTVSPTKNIPEQSLSETQQTSSSIPIITQETTGTSSLDYTNILSSNTLPQQRVESTTITQIGEVECAYIPKLQISQNGEKQLELDLTNLQSDPEQNVEIYKNKVNFVFKIILTFPTQKQVFHNIMEILLQIESKRFRAKEEVDCKVSSILDGHSGLITLFKSLFPFKIEHYEITTAEPSATEASLYHHIEERHKQLESIEVTETSDLDYNKALSFYNIKRAVEKDRFDPEAATSEVMKLFKDFTELIHVITKFGSHQDNTERISNPCEEDKSNITSDTAGHHATCSDNKSLALNKIYGNKRFNDHAGVKVIRSNSFDRYLSPPKSN